MNTRTARLRRSRISWPSGWSSSGGRWSSACGQRLDPAWPSLRHRMPAPRALPLVVESAILWSVAAAAGWSPDRIAALRDHELARLWEECDACPDIVKRQVYQEAYERTYRRQILDALAARRALPEDGGAERPAAQFVFCIDEREESIRRALEEQHPGYITFGAAGFFGVAIDYLGLYDREPAAHCPVVVIAGARGARTAGLHRSGLACAPPASAGSLACAGAPSARGVPNAHGRRRPLVPARPGLGREDIGARDCPACIHPDGRPPDLSGSLRRQAPGFPPSVSRVRHRPAARRKPLGFSLEESVDRVTAMLTNIGLVGDFAPIVIVLGHGSTSLNNPHESAHDCGACGGRRGGANARLFADMANRPDVREGVRRKGIDIPSGTWFVGALHDTASDEVRYFDLELLPVSHASRFSEAYDALDRARRDSALERCRRFDDAPLDLSPEAALRHVEARSSNLAQPRPEYGHCTNAICIVGRRSLTRGLHLDRRAFLVSYDPTIDPTFAIVERILAAVGPVGAGISLEYYFSSVDNERFGCGTKLPHNVTGLIGVMNGHQSDLRTGLPLQMVEIHEPMRLLLIVDATPEALLAVAGRQPEVAELVVNQWIQLVAADPGTGTMHVFEDGRFVPYEPAPTLLPVVERSAEWHMRTREHLPPALVRRALPESAVGPGHRPEAETVVLARG